jgi:hypothetical protein
LFPPVRSALHGLDRLDAGLFEELPNEFATFGAVIVEGFVGPFAGDQNTAPGDT